MLKIKTRSNTGSDTLTPDPTRSADPVSSLIPGNRTDLKLALMHGGKSTTQYPILALRTPHDERTRDLTRLGLGGG